VLQRWANFNHVPCQKRRNWWSQYVVQLSRHHQAQAVLRVAIRWQQVKVSTWHFRGMQRQADRRTRRDSKHQREHQHDRFDSNWKSSLGNSCAQPSSLRTIEIWNVENAIAFAWRKLEGKCSIITERIADRTTRLERPDHRREGQADRSEGTRAVWAQKCNWGRHTAQICFWRSEEKRRL